MARKFYTTKKIGNEFITVEGLDLYPIQAIDSHQVSRILRGWEIAEKYDSHETYLRDDSERGTGGDGSEYDLYTTTRVSTGKRNYPIHSTLHDLILDDGKFVGIVVKDSFILLANGDILGTNVIDERNRDGDGEVRTLTLLEKPCETIIAKTKGDAITYSLYAGNTDIVSIIIPEGVTTITKRAFVNCFRLEEVVLPSTLTLIDRQAFGGCHNLVTVCLPESLVGLEPGAFIYCIALEDVTIPSGISVIGEETFYGCTALKEVTLPESITCIKREAFAKCKKLTQINYQGSKEQWKTITLHKAWKGEITLVVHCTDGDINC